MIDGGYSCRVRGCENHGVEVFGDICSVHREGATHQLRLFALRTAHDELLEVVRQAVVDYGTCSEPLTCACSMARLIRMYEGLSGSKAIPANRAVEETRAELYERAYNDGVEQERASIAKDVAPLIDQAGEREVFLYMRGFLHGYRLTQESEEDLG